eukprot:2006489-Pyramimonas_sp.AAC.1
MATATTTPTTTMTRRRWRRRCKAVLDCIKRAEACASTAADVCAKAAAAFRAESQPLASARADVEAALANATRSS